MIARDTCRESRLAARREVMCPFLVMLCCLAIMTASSVASAQPAGKPLENLPATQREFDMWLLHVCDQLRFSDDQMVYVTKDKEPRLRLISLASRVAREDSKLNTYLNYLELNRQDYGRVNPLDIELLARIQVFEMPNKMRLVHLTNELSTRLVPDLASRKPPPESRTALPARYLLKDGVPKGGKLRYHPDSGLYQRFDDSRKEWIFEPGAKGMAQPEGPMSP